MRSRLSFLPWLLLLTFLVCQAMAGPESKYAHAAERVFAYMLYRLEGLSRPPGFDPTRYSIAKDCAVGKGRPCNLDEFITFISGGKNDGKPALSNHLPKDLPTNWYTDKSKIEDVIKAYAQAPDMDGSVNERLSSENILQYYDRKTNQMKGSGYVGLYKINYDKFISEVQTRVQNIPANHPQKIEANLIGPNLMPLMADIIKLRKAYQLNKMEEEMRKLFPDDRSNMVYRMDSKGQAIKPQLEPIEWHYHTGTSFAGKTFKALDFEKTQNDPNNKTTWEHFQTKIDLLMERVHKGTAGDDRNLSKEMKALKTHQPVIDAMSFLYTRRTGKAPTNLC
ncbi:hypothetical protein QC762_608310 [Podospora pseudocomata]|uniref:Uncharacterized protein n=1 Tax=Podospora pseudocomata TaxID=2093779 RepID=A0ABR0G8N1_9PEZI|nr:hypothetical protein QC762_608310 [Podospora pseudocomata]